MDAGIASLIEMLLVYGVVLAAAVWQLVSVRREIARDRAAAEAARQAAKDGAGPD